MCSDVVFPCLLFVSLFSASTSPYRPLHLSTIRLTCILVTGVHATIIVVSSFLICDVSCLAGYNRIHIYLSATQATVVTRALMPSRATEVLPVVMVLRIPGLLDSASLTLKILQANNRVATTVATKSVVSHYLYTKQTCLTPQCRIPSLNCFSPSLPVCQ